MNEAMLLQQNPWWESPDAIEKDSKIQDKEKSAIDYISNIFNEIPLEGKGVLTIRGPRQIGKSTLLKLLIKKLIKNKIDPRSIFYFSFNLLDKPEQIVEVYNQYKDFKQGFNIKNDIALFDEITYIKNWQLGIKHLIDSGIAKDTLFIVTGSCSTELRREAEKLPGRRGKHKKWDYVMLPLTFKEFLKTQKANVPIELFEGEDLLHPDIYKLKSIEIYSEKLENQLNTYLKTGGFPFFIDKFFKGEDLTSGINTIRDIIIGDFERAGKDRSILLSILQRIYETIGSRYSWNTFSDNVEAEAPATVKEYVHLLGDSFFTGILRFLDIYKNNVKFKKDKKIDVLDPLVINLITMLSGYDYFTMLLQPEFKSKVIEHVILHHLIRKYEEMPEYGFSNLNNVFYWYSNRGKEIDFILKKARSIYPIEVKYKNNIRKSDYLNLKLVLRKGIIVTKKDIFKDNSIYGIPLEIFLLFF
ncbi:ATP-binding protein [bacterium]|nr:ATP-binding protein [bacterium]